MPFILTKDDFFIPPFGKSIVRILPSWRGSREEPFFLIVPTHYEVNLQCRSLICRKMTHTRCPVCDLSSKLSFSAFANKQKRGQRMKAIDRVMLNVLPLGASSPLVWSISATLIEEIVDLYLKTSDEDGVDTHGVKSGRNLVIQKVLVGDEGISYSVKYEDSLSSFHGLTFRHKMSNLDRIFTPPSLKEYHVILGNEYPWPWEPVIDDE